ncbi:MULTISPECIES: sialidase family protein [unclassified Streptomyces]|uniref:sialidase family protein n=1 Tax=unclassified Streptomyces TaxID=2593676 RepID=UPI00114CFA7E|nr:sialidase family protein [Streptomyces sp. DvalAA-14]MYS22088.1 hypothetical protein [Streptomyces sp. SID4948]
MKRITGNSQEPSVPPAPGPFIRTRRRRKSVAGLALGVALGIAGALGAAPQAVAAGVANSTPDSALASVPQQVLFAAGTAGYGCFRIPALVRTKNGSLLAFAEGRADPACGDRGDNDLVERRSTDDGRTWGPIRVVASGDTAPDAYGTGPVPPGIQAGSPVTRSNPAPVVDLLNGRVYLLSTSNPVNNSYPRLPWVQESTDDGVSWSPPTLLNVHLDPNPPAGGSNWFATGPGHGVQLTGGSHPGRLVVGAHEKDGGEAFAGYLYLDPNADDTATWSAAHAVDSHTSTSGYYPSEVSVTEVGNGQVYAAARDEDGGATGAHRVAATVPDPVGTAVPSVPAFVPDALPSPGNIQGSVLTVQKTDATHQQELLLSAPKEVVTSPPDKAGQPKKTNMTIWAKCGTGAWNAGTPISGTVADRAGYSDLALLADSEIGLLYEGGANFSAAEIRFTRFSQAQLNTGCNTPPPGTSPQAVPDLAGSTPDASPQANDAYLDGTASLSGTDPLSTPATPDPTSQTFDKNLALSGGGFADVPYSRSLRTGTGDFTYSLWFKYQQQAADEPDRILFWSYGTGSTKPQVWLRTQSGTNNATGNRLYAWAQGGAADTASVTSNDTVCGCAFGDNKWHFVTLTRTGTQLSLQVDQRAAAPGTGAVTGDVTDDPASGVLGVRIGAKPDAAASNPFVGTIDEFRLYHSALTAAQRGVLAAPATSAAPVASTDPQQDAAANNSLLLRLPFQTVDQTSAPNLSTTVNGLDDESEHCTDGTLLGGSHVASASPEFGDALTISAADPGVTSELTPALDVADHDFTYSMWFRFSAATNNTARALLWAYGPKGTTTPA